MSLGRIAVEAGIANLNVTFAFRDPKAAKRGWEKVEQRCRWISANRAVDPADLVAVGGDMKRAIQQVIVATEDDEDGRGRQQIEKARRLLAAAGGVEIPTPDLLLEVTAANRARNMAAGGKATKFRNPRGSVIDADGDVIAWLTAGRG